VRSRECGVEDCVLGLLDRPVRVVDRERSIVFRVVGVHLRAFQIGLCPPGLDVSADALDVLVPRTLDVVPPDGQLALLRPGRQDRAAPKEVAPRPLREEVRAANPAVALFVDTSEPMC
jgi:hypothetical protein